MVTHEGDSKVIMQREQPLSEYALVGVACSKSGLLGQSRVGCGRETIVIDSMGCHRRGNYITTKATCIEIIKQFVTQSVGYGRSATVIASMLLQSSELTEKKKLFG